MIGSYRIRPPSPLVISQEAFSILVEDSIINNKESQEGCNTWFCLPRFDRNIRLTTLNIRKSRGFSVNHGFMTSVYDSYFYKIDTEWPNRE
ncbi:hypothetical protein NPIL_570181 [Nephila pilipes]|uniref:Uncharacterized protein n=1 Tax=Nephila pilipes TaxID=299642 RepID=A0A8X6MXC7_NEPPI|nr:hypothetical protein NPIL_570181 [Nephila pilipes]